MPRPRRPRRPRAAGNNQAVAIAVIAVGGLALLVLLVVAMGGDDEPAAGAPTQPPAAAVPKTPADPHADRRREARRWYERTFFDARGRAKELSGQEVHDLFQEAEKHGYPSVPGIEWENRARAVYESLLKREPFDPDANRFFGRTPLSDYPDFWDVWQRLTDAKAVPERFAAFRNEYEGRVVRYPRHRTPALDDGEWAAAQRTLDGFRAWEAEMAADPLKHAIFERLARLKLHPILSQYETVHIQVPPFVLFYADKALVAQDDSAAEKARVAAARAERTKRLEALRRIVVDYLGFFRTRYMKPLGLAEFDERTLLMVWVFGDREAFVKYGLQLGRMYPPGLLGYFSPRDHWVFLYEDPKDPRTVETSLVHELTHQLHWHFSKVDGSTIVNHFTRLDAVWLEEGWAEYCGWNERKGDAYTFGINAPKRMAIFHSARKHDLPRVPLKQLVRSRNYLQWMNFVAHPSDGWIWRKIKYVSKDHENMVRLLYLEFLYAQSWLFVHFLHEFENGKYKAKFLKFTAACLQGLKGYTGARGFPQPYEVFEEVFGLKSDAAWAAMEKEFDGYVERKEYEMPPPKED